MASRITYQNDTYPPVYFQVSDETGVLNLSTGVSSIQCYFLGTTYTFNGTATALYPFVSDPSGRYTWNVSYSFNTGDTAHLDTYRPYVVVTFGAGQIETFAAAPDTLSVIART